MDPTGFRLGLCGNPFQPQRVKVQILRPPFAQDPLKSPREWGTR